MCKEKSELKFKLSALFQFFIAKNRFYLKGQGCEGYPE